MLSEKYRLLQQLLSDMQKVVVAFSGGVDSTLLLKAALDTLGPDNVLAVTADSETYPASELQEAKSIAVRLGAPHRIITVSELSIPGYVENTGNRCYFCRKNLFEHLVPIMEEHGFHNVVYGLIADDMGDHRPGIRAAEQMQVRGPLQEAGLYKEEVRELSRELDLPTWDKPSFACLSSRIMYGEQITLDKLRTIDRAERFIREFGIRQIRVRTHGNIARIEADPVDMPVLLEFHREIAEKLKSLGYDYVTMDLTGYQSGSMNKVLAQSR